MTLYNLKTDGDQYRITKFDNDLNVESSYLVAEQECECPAGSRSTCRHRQMLPIMLAESLEDSGGFYDFDKGQVLMPVEDQIEETLPELPVGVQAVTFDDSLQVHNAIAKAVEEPKVIVHPTIGHIKRRI